MAPLMRTRPAEAHWSERQRATTLAARLLATDILGRLRSPALVNSTVERCADSARAAVRIGDGA
jgi:hypothetical protein